MPRSNIYVQQEHTIVLDGVPLSGFANGDYITVKADGNSAVRTQGGDGPAMSISVSQGGIITVSLLPTSPALGILYALRQAQKNTPRLFSLVMFTGTRELINCAGCAFGDLPQFNSGGPEQTGRVFSMEALQLVFDQSLVETILGGFVGGII